MLDSHCSIVVGMHFCTFSEIRAHANSSLLFIPILSKSNRSTVSNNWGLCAEIILMVDPLECLQPNTLESVLPVIAGLYAWQNRSMVGGGQGVVALRSARWSG